MNAEYEFKLRSTSLTEKGYLNLENSSVTLNDGSRAVTKGQLCAIYKGDQVIGGGWIA
ncbi:MAG: hypothetical protein LBG48_00750 [Rickettsiales bacterium]|jgi:tRNA U34 2-thiouridine synthase MnmA/TrmU|nr:hypothetical protein [Rickettsiales bacterium]